MEYSTLKIILTTFAISVDLVASQSSSITYSQFTDELAHVTTTTTTTTTNDDFTTQAGTTSGEEEPTSSKGKDEEGRDPLFYILAAVGILVVVVVTVVITLLVVKCCCAKNTKICPSRCCACCFKPVAPPPRLPPIGEVDRRSSNKHNANKDFRPEGQATDANNQMPHYVNKEFAKVLGRAKANTYTDQEMYTNMEDVSALNNDVTAGTSGLNVDPTDVTVDVEAGEDEGYYVNEGDEEGQELKEIARTGTKIVKNTNTVETSPNQPARTVVNDIDEDPQEIYENITDHSLNPDANIQNINTNSDPNDQQELYMNWDEANQSPKTNLLRNEPNVLRTVSNASEDSKQHKAFTRISQTSTGSTDSAKQRRMALACSGVYGNQDAVNDHYGTVVQILDETGETQNQPSTTPKPKPKSLKPSVSKNKPTAKPKPVTAAEQANTENDDFYMAPDPQLSPTATSFQGSDEQDVYTAPDPPLSPTDNRFPSSQDEQDTYGLADAIAMEETQPKARSVKSMAGLFNKGFQQDEEPTYVNRHQLFGHDQAS